MEEARDDRTWLTANECDELAPDFEHFSSTVSNLADYGASAELRCWNLHRIDPARVDPYQRLDDPDDTEGLEKVARMRQSLAQGWQPPPVIVAHQPDDAAHPWDLLEGRHRYNAALAEGRVLTAWVAHISCCGGPGADLPRRR